VSGGLARRIGWLLAGLVLVWCLNVARIALLLAAGAALGESAAVNLLHPVAGLILFAVAVLAMLWTAGRFGLTFDPPARAEPTRPIRVADAVSSLRTPVLVATALALVLGLTDAGLARYDVIAGGLGDVHIAPLDVSSVHLPGWQSAFVGSFSQAPQFFGPTASWNRVLYSADRGASPWSSVPIYMDVIDTPDSGALATYGLDACYQFHGYRIEAEVSVPIVPGVDGQIVDYRNVEQGTDWSAVWWQWPDYTGSTTRFERVVLFVSDGPGGSYGGVANGPAVPARRFQATDNFLTAFARAIAGQHVAQGVPA
jgi:exosortase/archaeosortase family protein